MTGVQTCALPISLARGYPAQFRIWGFCLGLLLMMALLTPHSWFGFGSILWAMGALATRAPVAPIQSRTLSLAIFVSVITLIRLLVRGPLLASHPWLAEAADLLSALSFILVMLAFRDGPETGYALLRHRIHKTLADFSFSLYAIHMPVVIFARAAASRATSRPIRSIPTSSTRARTTAATSTSSTAAPASRAR